MIEYALFETAIGTCGIAWSERGVVSVRFAESDEQKTRASLLRRCPGAVEAAPTVAIQRAIDGIVALLRGEPHDLRDVTIDDAQIPAFNRKMLEVFSATAPKAAQPEHRRETPAVKHA